MYRKIISMCMALVFFGAYARNYYEITGDNVNVRRAPVNGEIVGHLNTNNLVASGDPENGWLYVDLPELDIRGYVSEKFIKKLDVKDFSKTLLGEYMGEMKDGNWSYSLGTLKEKDGYLLLILTDYTKVEEGLRGHMTHVYAGVPDWEGISFTHYLYPYNDDRSLVEQIREATPLNSPYTFVITKDNKLRSVDRVLELQESYGIKDTPVSERNIFHLTGKVEYFVYFRTYTPDFLKMVKDDEYGDPFDDAAYMVMFSPEGDLALSAQFDDSAEEIAKYEFNYSNNGEVTVDGKVGENVFNAKYKRRISPFKIDYDGVQDIGSLQHTVEFNLDGYPAQLSSSNYQPPFVIDAYGDTKYTYYADGNPLIPTSGQMRYEYGPDAFQFDNVEFKDIKIDSVGNWILRKVYIDGICAYSEERNITYY